MLFIISGPSGVGKGTIIEQLLQNHPTLGLAISATTRAPRQSEQHGIDYYFMDQTTFTEHINNNDFVEWCQVHNYYYGTLLSEITSKLNHHSGLIIEIDVQGAQKIKAHDLPQYHILFVRQTFKRLKNDCKNVVLNCQML